MNIDTERVVSEVRLNPPLWDLSCNEYQIVYVNNTHIS
jgi:hypothetical protein